jgi:hypothetical protein
VSDATPDGALDLLIEAIAARDLTATLSAFSTEHDAASVVGSEAGETALGRGGIEGFFRRIYARPGSFHFKLPERTWARRGDMAWVVAEGTVVEPTAPQAKPYRLTGVFVYEYGAWRLALWSGAEPVRSDSPLP